ncbi:MAG: TetM/TetW/TetO/TetS family tetracycline resistance ribosomal protection protein [Lachnospiraceae bacterium]|nr:TetM/TetW/TetO/TetS family tetracycline resistance ribosomal protection protein [Lachnospiraceae bacterium]
MKRIVIGILAHVDAGKTTLSEALLYKSGFLKAQGRVDNKDAFLDDNEMERARGITIFSKQAILTCPEGEITLLDTPGHVDFSAEAERVLNALDAAVLVISATGGVQSHTTTLWKLLKRYNIPTFIFINKCDMPNADIPQVTDSLHNKLSDAITDLNDTEKVATCSEELLEEYLSEGVVSDQLLRKAVRDRDIFPMLTGSALKCQGIDELMDALMRYMEERPSDGELQAYCIKITRNEKKERLTHLKIMGGTLRLKELIGDEKVNEIRLYNGSRYTALDEATAGMVVALPGITGIRPGEYIGMDVRAMGPMLTPVLSYAVSYSGVDAIQMLKILRELEEELPELKVEEDEEHREIRVYLMGDIQTSILTRMLKDRYGVDASFGVGRISYRETVADIVEGVGHFEPLRHYAEVHLKIEPGERGSGLEFDSLVSEDMLAKNWQRLIMTHLGERVHRGVLTGSPITDMKITVVGGQAHNKHTEGGDFRQATYRAVRQGLMQAHSILLEPYYEYTLEIPEEYVGKALTDIDRMNGTSLISESSEGITVITGRAPVSAMHLYATDITAYTKGKGKLYLRNGGYEECHNTEEVLEKLHYDPDKDSRNPSSSVFCSHGVGTIVEWDQVFDNMHVPNCIDSDGSVTESEGFRPVINRRGSFEAVIGTDEIDEIINRTAYANRRNTGVAHKGISASRAGAKRNKTIAPVEVVYKGSPKRQKYLLVDGYNNIFAWKELSELAKVNIDAARDKLLDIMSNYCAMEGMELIVVFDAYKLKNHPVEYLDYHNIHVVYTRTAQTADAYIEHFAHEHGKKYDITVATSDGLEQIITRGEGCNLMSARELERAVEARAGEYAGMHGIDPVE